MVLFTFVVMLLNDGREELTYGSHVARSVGFPAVVAIFAVIATVILRAEGLGYAHLGAGLNAAQGLGTAKDNSNLVVLSQVLFHELLLPFEVTSVLILIAILGAVALAHSEGAERTVEK